MEIADLKRQNEKQLHELLAEKRTELREFRFKVSEGQMKNVHLILMTKKLVARILTVLKQKSQRDPSGTRTQTGKLTS